MKRTVTFMSAYSFFFVFFYNVFGANAYHCLHNCDSNLARQIWTTYWTSAHHLLNRPSNRDAPSPENVIHHAFILILVSNFICVWLLPSFFFFLGHLFKPYKIDTTRVVQYLLIAKCIFVFVNQFISLGKYQHKVHIISV